MLFNIRDIISFAIRIEENGEAFYRKASELFENEMKKMLLDLAKEEVSHKKLFENMLKELERSQTPESFAGEYLIYLRDYIDERIVFSDKTKNTILEAKEVVSVLDFALEMERDSITFYREIETFMPKRDIDKVEKIIEEEKRHFKMISERKRVLKGG